MIIDLHTHVFPEKIAEKSIAILEKLGNQKAVIGGTVSDLIDAMKTNGVNYSVVLPVLTKPEQFESINRFAAEIGKLKGIIPFGAIHPLCENIDKLLDIIVEMGFRGVKLHPDYQETDITDEGYIKILEGCRKRGLVAVIHAGIDPAYENHVHCPPELSSEIVKELTTDKSEPFIVLAHMGGIGQIEKVERFLVGLPVFFDTSFVLDETDSTRTREIILAHGYKNICFATDSPWRDAKQYIDIVKSLKLSEEMTNSILGDNCARLLKM